MILIVVSSLQSSKPSLRMRHIFSPLMTEQPPGTLSRDSPKASAVTHSSSSANFECSEASPTWRMLIATGSKEEPAFSDSIELVTRFELVFIVKGYLHSIWDHFFIYCLRTEVCYFFPVTPPSTSWTATPQCWLSKAQVDKCKRCRYLYFLCGNIPSVLGAN